MNIALLGGAFNPPHLGHILIARQVLDFAGVDEVWFLPNYSQGYLGGKNGYKKTASVEDRLAMVGMIDVSKTRLSTIETDNMLDGQTINLLPHLPKGNDYTFVMGSDWLSSFAMWNGWQDLLAAMKFLVFPRYGFASEPLYDNMTLLQHPALMASDISSTKIRERVRLGLSIGEFVPEGVADYIREHCLYV